MSNSIRRTTSPQVSISSEARAAVAVFEAARKNKQAAREGRQAARQAKIATQRDAADVLRRKANNALAHGIFNGVMAIATSGPGLSKQLGLDLGKAGDIISRAGAIGAKLDFGFTVADGRLDHTKAKLDTQLEVEAGRVERENDNLQDARTAEGRALDALEDILNSKRDADRLKV